ncbi:MAG: SDR family NAD(P)-dependent oxidoreductase [Zoogloeaceae bacterium]|nr:SDR family NAD(P)-dependent oxidoreductase [Zoogloeaceae bacterium]
MHPDTPNSTSFPPDGIAAVVGASGGIGAALLARLRASKGFCAVVPLGRNTDPALELCNEDSIAASAARIAAAGAPLRLVIDATGFLHGGGFEPEKSLSQLDPAHMAHAFAINAIGPAMLIKHLAPLLASDGKAVFATLSARVGSIGDNRLGGWYSYRASKAALNQLVHTSAIELGRRKPQAIIVALHPGTVASPLSAPFAKTGLEVRSPQIAADELLAVIERLELTDSGGFFDHKGMAIPW